MKTPDNLIVESVNKIDFDMSYYTAVELYKKARGQLFETHNELYICKEDRKKIKGCFQDNNNRNKDIELVINLLDKHLINYYIRITIDEKYKLLKDYLNIKFEKLHDRIHELGITVDALSEIVDSKIDFTKKDIIKKLIIKEHKK